jgi:hypothetical protein
MQQTFEVQAGNGRLYKLTPEKKQMELARLATLREKGQAWATDDKAHDYDGFLQIGQNFIDWLQEGLNQSGAENMRMNWKGHAEKTSTGAACMHIKGAWLGKELGMPDLKAFTDSGAKPASPARPNAPTAQPPVDALADDAFPDDDIPF